ncbi:hypothetical protein AURDEDRAFT_112951 [Auricularia subglabra TFB-10046 SS5]|nr:hypothetical protein AURDEDRAFT_112951 [Auricularia subglabra TFB-10046 SS5]
MHAIASFASLLGAILSARAVVLTSSGVYTLTAGSQAIVHASASATTITAPQFSPGATNQAWTIVVNANGTATFQNDVTRSFMAAAVSGGQGQIVPSTSPFSWNVVPSNGKNKFCVGADVCLSSTPGSSALTLAIANHGVEEFDANPATPPPGVYQIQNVANGRVIGAGFVPAQAFMAGFPANDRSEVWDVILTNSDTVALQNFDSAGYLSVQPQGVTVGTWDRSQVSWTIVYVDGVGQILKTSTGLSMTASGNGVVISGATDKTAAWVFYPEDPEEFLP